MEGIGLITLFLEVLINGKRNILGCSGGALRAESLDSLRESWRQSRLILPHKLKKLRVFQYVLRAH